MKVLQKKILILVISSISLSAIVVMAIALFNFERIVESNSEQIMQLMCSEKSQLIDEKLFNIEQSVHTLYHFAIGQISETNDMWQDEEWFLEHISRMRALMSTTVEYTDGAVNVYYRLAPDIRGPKQGVWLVQDANGDFAEQEMTDLSLYDPNDVEHVGWYYIPINKGKETWINPYYNQNIEEEIISYVIPIIWEGRVLGVVGMDIATKLLYETAKAVVVYDTGYAFLMDYEGEFIYHPEMSGSIIKKEFDRQHASLYQKSILSAVGQSVEDYQWNDIDKKLTSQKLRNGMIFSVCVKEKEVNLPQRKMVTHAVLVICVVMSVFIAVTVSIIKAIVKLMYTDIMTRVGNKTAYSECVDTLSKQMREKGKVHFAVFVLDVNELKKVNDTYGHEYGDLLIQNAASALKKVWHHKFVFRIGGDEFAIVCPDMGQEEAEKRILLYEETEENYNLHNGMKELYLQMAIGMAVYNPKTDKDYMDVFRRADDAMYENKKQKKNRERTG